MDYDDARIAGSGPEKKEDEVQIMLFLSSMLVGWCNCWWLWWHQWLEPAQLLQPAKVGS